MIESAFIDTNVFIYTFEKSHTPKKLKAVELIKIITAAVVFFTLWFAVGAGNTAAAQSASTNDIEALYQKGLAAYKANDYKTFLECFQRLDTMLANHPIIMYNLAAAYSLNNQPETAILYLNRLIIIDANPKIAADKDFDPIRQSPGFKEILSRVEELQKPVSTSKVAFIVKARDLHPESIAYDPKTDTFYLSGVHKRKIVSIDKKGAVTDFTTEGQDGLDAVLGIRIDAANRILWASCAASHYMKGYNEATDKGRTGVFKYHLDSKKLVKKYILQEGEDHAFDDVVLHPGGDVYVSDERSIYRIPATTDQLEPAVRHPGFYSIQGLDFCGSGEKMLAADYVSGVFLIEVASGKVLTEVAHPPDISLKGIDGLYYHQKSNSLVAIHNGLKPQRVMQYFLSSDFTRVVEYRVMEWANPVFNEPTLGVVVENTFYYIANSQWNGYDKNFAILPVEQLQDIIILEALIGAGSPDLRKP